MPSVVIGNGSGGGGRTRGSLVHEELHAWVTYRRRPSDRIATAVIEALRIKGYAIRAAEVVVWNGVRHGTAIDLVLYHSDTQRTVACELKTGMNEVWKMQRGRLAEPLDAYASHPFHHACMQVMCATLMAHHTRPGYLSPAARPLVLLANDERLWMEAVPGWVMREGVRALTQTVVRSSAAAALP